MNTLEAVFSSPELWEVAHEMRAWDESLFKHSVAVADLAALVAEELGFSREGVELARLAGFLHDFGKVTWPRCLVSKPDLGPDDLAIVRVHPLVGAALLRERLPGLDGEVLRVVEEHHERPGGGGYPRGLAEVSPMSRVVAAVECFVALVEERPYRKRAYGPAEALELARAGGFDSGALAALERLLREGKVPKARCCG